MALLATLLGALSPGHLGAQRVLGPADDATVLPRGMVRVTISPTWGRYHERFADGLGRTARGKVEPLAADFDLDSVTLAGLPLLTPMSAGLASILGATGPLPLTLGPLRARYDATEATTPIVVEYGASRRLQLGAVFPFVKTRTEVSLDANPGGTGGTLGVNPGLTFTTARATNALAVQELTAASQALQQLLQSCSGSSAPSCTAVNADRAGAQALVTAANNAASGIEAVYGTSASKPGSALSPVERSKVQVDVVNRLSALSTAFGTFLGAPGSGTEWIATDPVGAPPVAYGSLQQILTEEAYGIRADSLVSVDMYRLGDLELGAKFLLLDPFEGEVPQRGTPGGVKVRLAVAGIYRLGTGTRDSVDHLADIGTGDGQDDLEGRVFLDLLFGRRAWASVVGRYGIQQADELTLRVPHAPHEAFPDASRRQLVRRDLGDFLSLEVSPRYVVSENFALGAGWRYYAKGEDTYTLAGTGGTVDAGILALGTKRSEQRALVSVTYSTMANYFRGRARLPMEVSMSVGRVLSGSGNTPRQSITALTLRVYNQLF